MKKREQSPQAFNCYTVAWMFHKPIYEGLNSEQSPKLNQPVSIV